MLNKGSMEFEVSKKDLKRQHIIQAAAEVFGNSNFQSAGVSEIAQKANVAEGTIYQYFKNKEDLFFSIPAQKTEEFCEEFDLHLQGINDSLGKIRKLIWYYLYFFKANPAYARSLMLEMRVSKGFIRSETYGKIKAFTDKALEIVKEGQNEGHIRKDIGAHAIRELILGVLEHKVTRWLLKEEKYDLVENYDEVCALIFDGIKSSERVEGRNIA
jgi:TetR/AcrR family transcriptional regulator, fatty acid metabolism regulator protein